MLNKDSIYVWIDLKYIFISLHQNMSIKAEFVHKELKTVTSAAARMLTVMPVRKLFREGFSDLYYTWLPEAVYISLLFEPAHTLVCCSDSIAKKNVKLLWLIVGGITKYKTFKFSYKLHILESYDFHVFTPTFLKDWYVWRKQNNSRRWLNHALSCFVHFILYAD